MNEGHWSLSGMAGLGGKRGAGRVANLSMRDLPLAWGCFCAVGLLPSPLPLSCLPGLREKRHTARFSKKENANTKRNSPKYSDSPPPTPSLPFLAIKRKYMYAVPLFSGLSPRAATDTSPEGQMVDFCIVP